MEPIWSTVTVKLLPLIILSLIRAVNPDFCFPSSCHIKYDDVLSDGHHHRHRSLLSLTFMCALEHSTERWVKTRHVLSQVVDMLCSEGQKVRKFLSGAEIREGLVGTWISFGGVFEVRGLWN